MKNGFPRIYKPPTAGEAAEIIRRDVERMARSYSRELPIVVKRVKGSIVEDVNGNAYIDFNASRGVLLLGGGHQRIVQALIRKLEESSAYSLTEVYRKDALELAEELEKIVPIRGDIRVIFTESRGEAVDAAIMASRWHTGKKVVLGFLGSSHGSTLQGLTLSSNSRPKRALARILDAIYAPNPNCFRCPLGLKLGECGLRCLNFTEEIAEKTAASDLSAIIFEPIQVEEGVIIPPDGYHRGLAQMAKRLEALLIADEAFTAPARTGRWFALDRWNVNVDLVILGEMLSAGLPLGVVAAREDVLDLEPGMYDPVMGGCWLSIAAALETLQVIKDEGLVERGERIGRGVQKRLRDLFEDLELGWDVRGVGMLIGFEVVSGGDPDPGLAREIVAECLRVGLMLRRGGSTIMITPALNIEEEVLEKGMEILEEKVSELSRLSRASSS